VHELWLDEFLLMSAPAETVIWLPPNLSAIALPGEVWKKLPTGDDDEFWWASPIYYVSTLGRVYWYTDRAPPHRREGLKSLRIKRRPGKRPRHVTNLHVANGGYQSERMVYVSRLVLATHAGPEGAWKPLGRHGPGGSLDDRLCNLARGTYSENLRDQYAYGERGRGDNKCEYEPSPGFGF